MLSFLLTLFLSIWRIHVGTKYIGTERASAEWKCALPPPPLPTGAALALVLAEPSLLAVAVALEVALEVVAPVAPTPRTGHNHAS